MLAKVQKGIQKIAEAGFFALLFFAWYSLENEIPSEINIVAGEEEQFDFGVPVTMTAEEGAKDVFDNMAPKTDTDEITIHKEEVYQVSDQENSSFTMTCKLFGVIPVKEVDVSVVSKEELVPSGMPIGIYVETDGVLVIGTGSVSGTDGVSREPAASLLKSGDYICSVNGDGCDLVFNIKNEETGEIIFNSDYDYEPESWDMVVDTAR